ncbi:potassium channel family protein [Coraliomargarita parva]|uniref:potassium channel family protein n=1 Tax=Coraliomargarita parva TaxID=3014050 RepID=UPI0022B41B7A|nr:TrkA family potassium uptake protein [Coraliomargarita parva]
MKFCIIGLGQFGSTLAVELQREGHEVIAIDNSPEPVEAIKDKVDYALEADATDLRVLQKLGLKDLDTVVVAIGEGFEASLMIVAHLQKAKVKSILCRVINDVHERLLDLMQVQEKIRPEAVAARQLAKRMGIARAVRHFSLGDHHALVEFPLPESFIGKNLAELELRGRYELNLITYKRPRTEDVGEAKEGDDNLVTQGVPTPDTVFHKDDRLILFGEEQAIEHFSKEVK